MTVFLLWMRVGGSLLRTLLSLVVLMSREPVLEVPPASEVAPTAVVEVVRLPVYVGSDAPWHQANDAMIARVVEAFNAEKGWVPGHPYRLDPATVKAWALQESGSHEGIFTAGDMMQVNNPGDWAPEKRWIGLERGMALDPEASLRAALLWAYHKGLETRRRPAEHVSVGWHPTRRGDEVLASYESRFVGWDVAIARYNGGGVRDYLGGIRRRQAAVVAIVRPDPVHGPRMVV